MRRFSDPKSLALFATVTWLGLAIRYVRAWLELSIARHMLLQLPLLAVIGACLGAARLGTRSDSFAARALGAMQSFNTGGATGMLAASFG